MLQAVLRSGSPPVIVHDGHERLETARLGIVRDRHAPAGRDVEKALPPQLTDPLVDDGFADFHLVGQLPLGGQAVARAQLAREDQPRELLDEELADGGRDDFLKRHNAVSFPGRTTTI